MAKFTIRIELHDAVSADYSELHDGMTKQGFSNIVVFNSGVRKRMPPAEYNFSGEKDRDEILQKVHVAAEPTGCEYEVLITESAGRTGWNLKPA